MRVLSLAVVATLLAVGFGYAQDKTEKKAEKKAGKTTGTLSKIDGTKLTVTTKGDGGEKTVEFTTTDKTKFFQEEAAPAAKDGDKKEGEKPAEEKKADPVKPAEGEKKVEEKKADETKPAAEGGKKAEKKPAAKRTEIKLADLKTGARVAVTAGEDKVATEVVVLPAPAKKEGK
jgi:glutamyl/glutaminyl-tRNA synthetase